MGSATITGSSGGCAACSGSTSVTVVLTGVNSITVSPSSRTAKINGSPVYFTAIANPGGDITENATWNVTDSTNTNQNGNFTIGFVAGSGEGFTATTATPGTYTVTASYPSTTAVGTATLTVQTNDRSRLHTAGHRRDVACYVSACGVRNGGERDVASNVSTASAA